MVHVSSIRDSILLVFFDLESASNEGSDFEMTDGGVGIVHFLDKDVCSGHLGFHACHATTNTMSAANSLLGNGLDGVDKVL